MGDPLISLHSDVFDLIFQHLSWSELASLSTVCRSWYQAIAESRACMKKVEVKISNSARPTNSYQRGSLNTLRNASRIQRHYQNITADFSDQKKIQILKILKPACRLWRSVHLLNARLANENFASTFCDTVVLLTLTRVKCIINTDDLIFTFPRLKELKLMSCNEKALKIFRNCSGLQKLHVSSNTGCDEVTDILVNNAVLEDLSMCVPDFSKIFSAGIIEKVKFKLKKIAIESFKDFTAEDKKSLKLLLETQSQSLEIVHLNPWCGTDIIETCWRMEQLKDFSFNLHHREYDIDWSHLALPINLTIQRINLCDVLKNEDASFYESIFKSTPNLKIYKSKCMQAEEFEILSSRCKKLQELYIEEFDISVLPTDPLPNVEKFRSWEVNDILLQTLKAKTLRNGFEDKVLDNA